MTDSQSWPLRSLLSSPVLHRFRHSAFFRYSGLQAVAMPLARRLIGRKSKAKGGLKAARLAAARSPKNPIVLRRLLVEFRRARQYEAALGVARRLCRLRGASMVDTYERFDLLNKLGRFATTDRYVRWLSRARDRGSASNVILAQGFWSAHRPSQALITLGGPSPATIDDRSAEVALRCFVKLRRYREAASLIEMMGWRRRLLPTVLVEQALAAARFLDAEGIVTPPGTDAALPVIDRWIEMALGRPRHIYEPVRKRVALYAQSFRVGGSERQVLSLMAALAKCDDVESTQILIHDDSGSTYDVGDTGWTIHAIDGLPAEDHPSPMGDPLINEVMVYGRLFGVGKVVPLLKALCHVRPEVVHARSGYYSEMALACLLASTPRVVVHFGSMTRASQFTSSEFENVRRTLIEHLCAGVGRSENVMFAANSAAAATDWARQLGVPQGRIKVLYNGLDEGRLGFERQQSPVSDGENAKVVGGVFRLYGVKDPLLWINVARRVADRIPSVRFLVVGEGPLREAMIKRINDLGLQDSFEMPGLITDGLADFYSRMDVFLLTSRTESLPNAIIEAQFAGVPVVAPDVGGIGEALAGSSTGYLTERNEEALAEGVINALSNDTWRKQVAETAPGLIRSRFSLERLLSDTREAYGWGTLS